MGHGDDDTLVAREQPSLEAGRDLRVGQLFAGRYQVEAVVGRGGMGTVYRVRDIKLDEVVALKRLVLHGDGAEDRFFDEVRLARRVTHPNVARTHDVGEHAGTCFLTMEFIEGTTLDEALAKSGALPPPRVAALGAAIADGLSAAHVAGIVHRDLKPSNIMLTGERVVITDFGIAQPMAGATAARTQSVVGTPAYMAPEQVMGAPLDARADLFALGVMLFELLTNTVPFEGDGPMAIAISRLNQAPPDPRQRAPVPDRLAELVLRCMARSPDDRPRSAAEVRTVLLDLRGDAPHEPVESIRSSGPFAPLAPAGAAVAVLPFAYRGPSGHDYLGDGLTEELIDTLCRTRGLKVLSLGSTQRFTHRDPIAIGREIEVAFLVDGTVQMEGDRVRLAARLVDTANAEQRWSDRFEGNFGDVFALQESMGRRVAEALRVELSATAHTGATSAEAIEPYLKARKFMRTDVMSHSGRAVQMLDQSLRLAPSFSAAIAAHAMASVRAWWGHASDLDGTREARAEKSVARAIEQAPQLAETHFARAMLAVQRGDFQGGTRALGRALQLAPTMADAHQYLGELQVEAGRVDEGLERLTLAIELDPCLSIAHISLARVARLLGDEPTHARHRQQIERLYPSPTLPILNTRFRWAMYEGDGEEQRHLIEQIEALPGGPARRMARLFGVVTGKGTVDDAHAILGGLPSWLDNMRFTTFMEQVIAEVFAAVGAWDECVGVIDRSSRHGLIDVLWLERCPLLGHIRNDERLREAERLVHQRTAEMWRR